MGIHWLICIMIKTKAHESEINEIDEEGKLRLGSPLALLSKVTAKDSEVEYDEEEKPEEEGFLVNSGDEAVTYYSNNKVKKFFKKPFKLNIRTTMSLRGITHREEV